MDLKWCELGRGFTGDVMFMSPLPLYFQIVQIIKKEVLQKKISWRVAAVYFVVDAYCRVGAYLLQSMRSESDWLLCPKCIVIITNIFCSSPGIWAMLLAKPRYCSHSISHHTPDLNCAHGRKIWKEEVSDYCCYGFFAWFINWENSPLFL